MKPATIGVMVGGLGAAAAYLLGAGWVSLLFGAIVATVLTVALRRRAEDP